MQFVTIPETKKGEIRWVIRLIDGRGRPVPENTEPLSRQAALPAAKALRHGGGGKFKFGLGDPDAVKGLEARADIRWDPPGADPAHQKKRDGRTGTRGIPGSSFMGLSEGMQRQLAQSFDWRLENVRELDSPVLMVLDYSPSNDRAPVSIAFDVSGGPECWLSESTVYDEGWMLPEGSPALRGFRL